MAAVYFLDIGHSNGLRRNRLVCWMATVFRVKSAFKSCTPFSYSGIFKTIFSLLFPEVFCGLVKSRTLVEAKKRKLPVFFLKFHINYQFETRFARRLNQLIAILSLMWSSWCHWNAATRRALLVQVVLSWIVWLAISSTPVPANTTWWCAIRWETWPCQRILFSLVSQRYHSYHRSDDRPYGHGETLQPFSAPSLSLSLSPPTCFLLPFSVTAFHFLLWLPSTCGTEEAGTVSQARCFEAIDGVLRTSIWRIYLIFINFLEVNSCHRICITRQHF